ncbi:hypothetical protein [Kitasatospora sp. DSM 101779]|uniref:hypothetical protein n=1 Tax=Kitasatospora sp. DSM 101779 TaxID=2853165 RepID=UPI0021D9C275|nr:hypothetical protein [Kitasatospora sp. DSM 101779]MCU7824621.1 hypothetical protein [Kitasatospora sp. DSM 101779]
MVNAADSGGGGGGGTSGIFYNVVSTVTAAQTAAMVAQSKALAGQVGAQAVKVEVENLQTFKNKVDAILKDLDGSPASHGEVSQQQLQSWQLGQNFGQAGSLMSAYATVHANLEQLSRTLSLQIEAMSASIDMAARGYANSDEEQRQKFQTILNQADQQTQASSAGVGRTAAGGGSYAQPAAHTQPAAQPATGTQQGSY